MTTSTDLAKKTLCVLRSRRLGVNAGTGTWAFALGARMEVVAGPQTDSPRMARPRFHDRAGIFPACCSDRGGRGSSSRFASGGLPECHDRNLDSRGRRLDRERFYPGRQDRSSAGGAQRIGTSVSLWSNAADNVLRRQRHSIGKLHTPIRFT